MSPSVYSGATNGSVANSIRLTKSARVVIDLMTLTSHCMSITIKSKIETASTTTTVGEVMSHSSDADGNTATDTTAIVNMGLAACRIMLQREDSNDKDDCTTSNTATNVHMTMNSKQRRICLELESHLYEVIGDVEQAAASTAQLLNELAPEFDRTSFKANVTVVHQKQTLRLRELRTRLGLVEEDDQVTAAKTARAEQQRNHRRRNRHRQREKLNARLGERLVELAPQVETILGVNEDNTMTNSFFKGLAHANKGNGNDGDATMTSSIPWDEVPSELRPDASTAGGIRHHKEKRTRRKRRQLEALYTLLKNLIDKITESRDRAHDLDKPLHIVDFGAGSGNSCLVFAWLLLQDSNMHGRPRCRFTLVDSKSHAVALGQQRTIAAGLGDDTVAWLCDDVADFEEPFDIGLATHLCGGATDLAMAKCFDNKAAFLVTPCCLGKLKFDAPLIIRNNAIGIGNASNFGNSLQYPRSAWLRKELSCDEYVEMSQLGDCNCNAPAEEEGDSQNEGESQTNPLQPQNTLTPLQTQLGLQGKALLDADRLELARENNYVTELGRLGLKLECGPKSDVLCGFCRL